MRLQRSAVATTAVILSLAGGGGVAWACSDPGSQGSTGTTGTTTTTTSTTGTTTTASTTAAVRHRTRRHSSRHATRG